MANKAKKTARDAARIQSRAAPGSWSHFRPLQTAAPRTERRSRLTSLWIKPGGNQQTSMRANETLGHGFAQVVHREWPS